ncbi:MAG: DUF2330 domain-containing protein [Myxococcales bacterium]|nr:DUF2330 domain-containing protein [Myxococcales bacterium]
MRKLVLMLAALVATLSLVPRSAQACGGFFCGQQPVDQSAERILFAVGEDGSIQMITQISYKGAAADFAWVVPIAELPLEGSLATFPQLALAALDANTGPVINGDWDCVAFGLAEADGGGAPAPGSSVTVYAREEVGPYDVAVLGSTVPGELITWLRDNGYRVSDAMAPYIADYEANGLKFIALKLLRDASVEDIAPFSMTLPGGAPVIPLQMTALAAEPEMGIVVTILGAQRYEAANWPNLEVDLADVVFDYWSWRHNWTTVVARTVDAAGGQGFVTEMAAPTAPLLERLLARAPSTPEQVEAQLALQELLGAHPYLSRLYTRLSAEEMTSDPMFRLSAGGDVDRVRDLPPSDASSCDVYWGGTEVPSAPCDFVACGAGGICREALVEGATLTGCACVPGTTARTTFDPDGRVTVACQDQRMSFLNPGDVEIPGATPLPDPCVGFECGAGTCVAMNMTPTCICEQGLVAVGSLSAEGGRLTRCVTPTVAVPGAFYDRRLPSRRAALPVGREYVIAPPPLVAGGGGCSIPLGAGSSGAPAAMILAAAWLVLGARRRRA